MARKEVTEKEVKAKAKKEIKKIDIDKDKIMQEIKNELTIKLKEQVTKELIDDIKKDVSILVKEDVKNDLTKELNREMKKENRRILRGKRGKIFRRDIVIIILLLIIGYLLYYMYNHNYVSLSISSNMNNNTIVNDKKVVSSKEDYDYLLNLVNVKLPIDNTNSLYLYNNNYKEKDINDSIRLTMAFNSVNKDEFTKEELINAYIKTFGSSDNYKDASFDYECKHFKYDNSNDSYILTSNDCSIESSKEIVENIISTDVKKDKIIMTTVVGIYDNSNKSLYNYKNIYEPVASNVGSNFDIKKYQNKLNSYKYTFKIEDDKYYFYSIEK